MVNFRLRVYDSRTSFIPAWNTSVRCQYDSFQYFFACYATLFTEVSGASWYARLQVFCFHPNHWPVVFPTKVPRRTLCSKLAGLKNVLVWCVAQRSKRSVIVMVFRLHCAVQGRSFEHFFMFAIPLALHCHVTVLSTRGHPPFNSSSRLRFSYDRLLRAECSHILHVRTH